jgi:hypothetical protein
MYYPHENDMGFALEAVNKINRIRSDLYHNYLQKQIKNTDAQYLFLNKVFQKWTNHRNYDMRIQ